MPTCTAKTAVIPTTSTHFVKANQVDLSADIDPLWADAENAKVFEASLGIHNASCHGGWQRWWHSDGDDVQGLYDDGLSWHLGRQKEKKSGNLCMFDNHLSLITTSTAINQHFLNW